MGLRDHRKYLALAGEAGKGRISRRTCAAGLAPADGRGKSKKGQGMGQPIEADAVGRSAMRKALWRILPLILLAFLCATIDRANIGFAALQMNVDLGFSATVYGLGAGLFYLSYGLFEIPSNLMAVRYGSRPWLARIMVSWGLVSAAMMFVHTPLQFYLMRFLLGMAEAGFYPGVIYYFAFWFPSAYRGRAISRFYVASPLAALVMGAVSGALLDLGGLGGLRGWQWLFLVEGIPSVLVGLAILRFLPDRPAGVTWLTAQEKAWIEDRLMREAADIGEPARHDVLACLKNPKVLLLAATGFSYIAVTNTIVLSAPLILQTMTGFGATRIGTIVSTGGVLGAIAMLVGGIYVDRQGDRFLNAFLFTMVLSAAVLAMALAPTPLIGVGAYLLFATMCFPIAMFVASGWGDVLHVRELAVGAAAINGCCQFGAFLTPYGFGALRDATGGYGVGLFALTFFGLVSAWLSWTIRAGMRRRKMASSVV